MGLKIQGVQYNVTQPTHEQGVAHNVDRGVNGIFAELSHLQLGHLVPLKDETCKNFAELLKRCKKRERVY